MTLLESATEWVNGEVTQGKVMLAAGILLLVAGYFLWQQGGSVSRGILIPLIVTVLVFFGYGGWLVGGRPAQLKDIEHRFEVDQAATIAAEQTRASGEVASYKQFKWAWVTILVVAVVGVVVISQPFFYGIALGLLLLGTSALTVDTYLSGRIGVYLEQIVSLNGDG